MKNTFDLEEFNRLNSLFGGMAVIMDITVVYQRAGYFNKIKDAVENDRRGEVVFAVFRPDRRVITVRSEDYPEGIFRIPTGGINYGENILESVYREVREELGLQVNIRDFPGVIKIRFKYETEEVMFYSYVFMLDEEGGDLLADALEDEVSEIIEADVYQLKEMVKKLKSLYGTWRDWGTFRAITTGFVAEHFLK